MMEIAAQLDDARERLRDSTPPASYLTVPEAAELARCHERTVRRAIASGRLPAFRPAHRVLVRVEDVRVWVESRAAVELGVVRAPRRQSRGSASVEVLRGMDPELGR